MIPNNQDECGDRRAPAGLGMIWNGALVGSDDTPAAIARCSGVTSPGASLMVANVGIKFGAELGQGVLDRPRGAVGEAADRGTRA